MDKYLTGRNAVLVSALLFTGMLGSSALAEPINFTASTHINRGTCKLSSGTAGLTFDFKNVTPVEAFAGTKSIEQPFTLSECVAVNSLSFSLSSTNTVNIASGTYKGKWVLPATGGATGVAFKTEIKSVAVAGTYYPLQADGATLNTGTEKFTPSSTVTVKATVIPTVANTSDMVAGSLASSAVVNITYL